MSCKYISICANFKGGLAKICKSQQMMLLSSKIMIIEKCTNQMV